MPRAYNYEYVPLSRPSGEHRYENRTKNTNNTKFEQFCFKKIYLVVLFCFSIYLFIIINIIITIILCTVKFSLIGVPSASIRRLLH